MDHRLMSVVRRYSMAAAAVALALLLTMAIAPVRREGTEALFFAAVMIGSWYGGLRAGLVATALATFAIDYVLMPPSYALILGPGDLARISVFVAVALVISSLNASQRRLGDELRRRAEQLADADRRKDEFLAMLAHELRNPLSAIRSALEVMGLNAEDARAMTPMREIALRQVRRMTRLVDDLQDASRVGCGTLALRTEEVELGSVIDQAVEAVRPAMDSRGHELSVMMPAGPIRLEADPTRLEQVVINLLTNAARYTDPGGRIWIAAEQEGDAVLLRVRDTGMGIAPEMLPHVFGLFVQEKRAGQDVGEGLGIGLSLVRGLVELHGGRVEVRSDGPGCGSEFVVTLPAGSRRYEPARSEPGDGRDRTHTSREVALTGPVSAG